MASFFDFIDAVAQSHVGVSRQDNQDFLGVVKRDDMHAFFIADGMGGAKGGSLASTLAVKSVNSGFGKIVDISPDSVSSIVNKANIEVYKESLKDPSLKGMGTTLVGAIVSHTGSYLFNVGDSRIYRLRDRKLSLISRDHTVLNELIDSGDESVNNPNFINSISHILTRSIGPNEEVEVDCVPLSVEDGDVFLLCSDGLYNMVNAEKMYEVLREFKPSKAVDELIKVANDNGGSDNITVMVVKIKTGCQELIKDKDEDSPWKFQVFPQVEVSLDEIEDANSTGSQSESKEGVDKSSKALPDDLATEQPDNPVDFAAILKEVAQSNLLSANGIKLGAGIFTGMILFFMYIVFFGFSGDSINDGDNNKGVAELRERQPKDRPLKSISYEISGSELVEKGSIVSNSRKVKREEKTLQDSKVLADLLSKIDELPKDESSDDLGSVNLGAEEATLSDQELVEDIKQQLEANSYESNSNVEEELNEEVESGLLGTGRTIFDTEDDVADESKIMVPMDFDQVEDIEMAKTKAEKIENPPISLQESEVARLKIELKNLSQKKEAVIKRYSKKVN